MPEEQRRENYYLLLELPYDPPETNQTAINDAIKKKQVEWSQKRNINPQFSLYLNLLTDIKQVMGDSGQRAAEAAEAKRLKAEEKKEEYARLDNFIKIICQGKTKISREAVDELFNKFPGIAKEEILARLPIPIESQPLDTSVMNGIREKLVIVSPEYESLYDFLSMPHNAKLSKLSAVTEEKDKELKSIAKKDAKLAAAQYLVGQCRTLLCDEEKRGRYDESLLQVKLSVLDEQIDLAAMASGNHINVGSFSVLLAEAQKNKLPDAEVREYIMKYCRKKGITYETPSPPAGGEQNRREEQDRSEEQRREEQRREEQNRREEQRSEEQRSESSSSKWHDKKWLVMLLLFVFFPAGLYGLWKSARFSTVWKIGLTVLILLAFIGVQKEKRPSPAAVAQTPSSPPVSAVSPTPAAPPAAAAPSAPVSMAASIEVVNCTGDPANNGKIEEFFRKNSINIDKISIGNVQDKTLLAVYTDDSFTVKTLTAVPFKRNMRILSRPANLKSSISAIVYAGRNFPN
ncbi:MAG: hypothetical protein LBO03_10070 [Acidaminococcales bacterium]|jgi:hypothetical protein|nr:hypothetical protein [Acidaminococcales bacterium]